MESTYVNKKFTKHIKDKVEIIFECGSRDGLDALVMLDYYQPKKIFSFECNPESIVICENNIKNKPEIVLVPKAVGGVDGEIDFFSTDMERSKDKNIGASSALFHLDNKESFFQKKIVVKSVTLETFINENSIENVDLLCLDLQGYEKVALEGLGDKINRIKYIISEVSFRSFYINDTLFDDLKLFLEGKGFQLLETISYGEFGDSLFINKNL